MNFLNGFCVSHPTGNTFVRALLNELSKTDRLCKFFTTIGIGQNANPLLKLIGNRREYSINDELISRQWIPELFRLLGSQKKSQKKKTYLTDRSYKSLDLYVSKQLEFNQSKVVHSYEDCSAMTFRRAKKLGIQCSYELPIVHWVKVRRLLAEEAERFPEWEPTLESTFESEEKLAWKDEELRLADYISCPSRFVLNSIPAEIREKKHCQIVPFGSPLSPEKSFPEKPSNKRSLKVLFVGSMTQRKGLADLFEAMKIIRKEPVSLSILGQPSMPMEFYRRSYNGFHYFPPCSNKKVRQIMLQHDVLILPSIVEGRALVQQEALSCGLPIIVTPNAGGEDLVEDGITGWLVPARSPSILAEKITQIVENIHSLDLHRVQCKEKAAMFTWSDYAQKIIKISFDNSFQPK